MRAAEISPEHPYRQRLLAYLRERFPPVSYAVLIVSYYSSNQFLAQALSSPDQPLQYSIWSIFGAAAVLCSFFYLRVFDEHKDFAEDRVFHPERLLQRGVVTLAELRLLAAGAITLQIGLAAWRGTDALLAALFVLGFALLMLKEFFVKSWLRRHFLVYTLSHMLIMPLYALQIFSFTTNRPFWEAPGWYTVYALVGFFVTLNWEISRKIRAPEEERLGLETYSSRLGTYAAGWAVLGVRAVDTIMVAAVGWRLGLSWIFYTLLVLLYLVCVYGFVDFRLNTSPRSARRMEAYAGIYIIAFDLILASELARQYGVIVNWSCC